MAVPTDPIADFLTRIRNASRTAKSRVTVPGSKVTLRITELLKQEGYIESFKWVEEGFRKSIRIHLKYRSPKKSAIQSLLRVSKPGLRCYVETDKIPRVLGGLGMSILSTSKGMMTDRQAREAGVGGELLCQVW